MLIAFDSDLPALPFSVGERIVLAGDAAHGTTPHQVRSLLNVNILANTEPILWL